MTVQGIFAIFAPSIFFVVTMKIKTIIAACVAFVCGCGQEPDITLQDKYHPNQTLGAIPDSNLAARCYNGVFVGVESDGVVAFKGIPYSKPPVGELRWKAPERPDSSAAAVEARYFGKAPVQTRANTILASFNDIGEDCLYLNVWKSAADTAAMKPVMVYIHGGSYGWGGSMDPLYNGANLVRRHPDVILATVGYRLGMMGFIDFSGVEGGDRYPDAPNLGLLDQVAALQWIKENITAFGGDPGNITVFGESAGAGSVSILSVMPAAKGLFQKAICESGSIALTYSKDECRPLTERLLQLTGATNVAQLASLSEDEIISLNLHLNDYANFPQRDGRIVPADLYEAYRRGDASEISMIMGTNSDESRYWQHSYPGPKIFNMAIRVLLENDIADFDAADAQAVDDFLDETQCEDGWEVPEFYNEVMFRLPAIKQAEGQSNNGAAAYMYYWRYPSAIPHFGAAHLTELSYVFGNLDVDIYTGSGNIDTLLSRRIQDIWVNFARSGVPADGNFTMPRYDTQARATTVFNSGNDIATASKPLDSQRQRLDAALSYHLNGNTMSLSLNVPYVWKCGVILVLTVGIIVAGAIYVRRRKRPAQTSTEFT